MNAVVQRLVDDLKSIERDGFIVKKHGKDYVFQAGVAFFCTDNLAAHTLTALFENFSALRSCRFCMSTREERQVKFSNGECTLRTQEAYMKQVALVERHPQLRTVYGIKGNSPFSRLEYFSPILGFPIRLGPRSI